MKRSILAVVAGLGVSNALAFLIEWPIEAALPGFQDGLVGTWIMIGYSVACGALGGYLAVLIAKRFREAWIMALVTLLLGLVAWLEMSALAPPWVWAVLNVLGPLSVLAGGRMRSSSRAPEPSPA